LPGGSWEGTGLEGVAGESGKSWRTESGVRGITTMELNCGTRRETGVNSDWLREEESSEVESGGLIGGLRGFQGEPRFGLPLGRGIGYPVQLAEKTKVAWWRGMAGASALQWRSARINLICAGRSSANRKHKWTKSIVNQFIQNRSEGKGLLRKCTLVWP
jgi:hypothetical protein